MNTTISIITGLWGGERISWPAPAKRDVSSFTTLDGLNKQLDSLPGRTGLIFAAIPEEDGNLSIRSFKVTGY